MQVQTVYLNIKIIDAYFEFQNIVPTALFNVSSERIGYGFMWAGCWELPTLHLTHFKEFMTNAYIEIGNHAIWNYHKGAVPI